MATVIYQVFVDRFAASREVPAGRRAWHLPPEEPSRGRDFYGGDLDGVVARLEHIALLGADAIYLTPIFAAPSNHKYDTSDFDRVDEQLGGDAAFERLATALRARGMGLILDGVFNHVGDEHAWAREPRFAHHLRGSVWRGHASLPELDLAQPDVQAALAGDDGVVARWIRRGATGFRLDCANDLGKAGCALLSAAARKAGARDGVIGELMSYPADWTREDGLSGVMNYWFRSAALGLATGRMRAAQVQLALDRLAAEMPLAGLLASWNMLSSHDTPRLETALDGDRAKVKLVLTLQLAYPGVPVIYYGEEIGMRGGADPANRGGMIWDEGRWDRERLALVRRLTALRQELRALREGRYVAMPQPGRDLIAFARVTDRPEETLVYVANAAGAPKRARLFLPLSTLYDALPLRDRLQPDAPPLHPEQGTLEIDLDAHGARLLQPFDRHASGYRFFK
jgi:glycosidase